VEFAFLIFGMMLVTFSTRLSMIAILGRWSVPPVVHRALRYVPIAAFAAIITPEVVMRSGQLAISLDNPRFLAGVLAIVVAYFSHHTMLTIIVGMGAMWIFQFLIGK
jgi:branched-subunit amino acid transport protein